MHQRGWRQLPNYALWAGIFLVRIGLCANIVWELHEVYAEKEGI